MVEELVDVVILGVFGFMGKYVLCEIFKFVSLLNVLFWKIVIVGCFKKKFVVVLIWVFGGLNVLVSFFIFIYEVDVSNVELFVVVCKKIKLFLNCVGLYRKYGWFVVEVCVEVGVDYFDIIGELDFMEWMEYLYYEKVMQIGLLYIFFFELDCVIIVYVFVYF